MRRLAMSNESEKTLKNRLDTALYQNRQQRAKIAELEADNKELRARIKGLQELARRGLAEG